LQTNSNNNSNNKKKIALAFNLCQWAVKMFIQIYKNIYVHMSNAQISEVRERNGKRKTPKKKFIHLSKCFD